VRIVIPDDNQRAIAGLDCFAELAGHDVTIYADTVSDEATLVERFRAAEALVLTRERTRVTASLLAELPELRLIAQTGRGTAHIDLAACAARGITVSTGSGSPVAPAELTFGLILAALRHIPRDSVALRDGNWEATLGSDLRGRTLGICGYGGIGSVVAGYGVAFGMRVVVWGREGSLARARADGFATASFGELFAAADVVCLHVKLTPETTCLVTAGVLATMKPTALLVNTARAGLIEPGALAAALAAGRPGAAAVDVFDHEPVTGSSDPLIQHENALCTPHSGYVTRESYELYFSQAFAQINAFAES
jgi:D-3-phosphoglycerate dehydrogenase / 2-oxoglutarate reductase